MNFVPLHVYSSYSLFKSGLKLNEYVQKAVKCGYEYLSLTDLNTFSGLPSFVKTCHEHNVKPIVGIDLEIESIKFTFIVINECGYKTLLNLAYKNEQKEINLKNINSYINDDLMTIYHSSNVGLTQEFSQYLAKISKGINNFYIGLEYNDINKESIREYAKKYNYPLLAFPFVCYLNSEDAISIKMLEAILKKERLNIKKYNGNDYLLSMQELSEYYSQEEINLTYELAKKVEFNLLMKRGQMVAFPGIDLTSEEYLRKISYEGLDKLGINNETYKKRLDYELDVISKMGYCDYFLIVKDIIDYSREQKYIIGPGRGSAVGSLVAYALGITQADPIKYNLLFERFLNIHRQSMPDIDIDIDNIHRNDVVRYLYKKYGQEHVSKIITVTKISSKVAIKYVGSIFNYNDYDINLFTKLIKRSNLSLRELYKTNYDFRRLVDEDKYYLEIVTYAQKLEGLVENYGLHTAGVVLNNEPLNGLLPLKKDDDGLLIEQFEKDFLEEQAFLKMDLLSILNLVVIDNCLNLIKKDKGIEINVDEIPYDDDKAISLIASSKTMGLFQIESKEMRESIKITKPKCFEDIVTLISLYRPGALDNIKQYAYNKFHQDKIKYISHTIKDILKPTYGIIIYQEQVMQIANVMANFTFAEADLLRRAIAKKDSKKLCSYESKFLDGAIKNCVDKNEAIKVFKMIEKFGDYGFNKSHAVGYAILTCRMAYLKAHYPLEFYTSILTNGSYESLDETINEMRSLSINILNPDINISKNYYVIKNDAIYLSLNSIKDITSNLISAIIYEQNIKPFDDFIDFVARISKYKIDGKQILALINAGAFDNLEKSRASLRGSLAIALNYASLIGTSDGETLFDEEMFPKPALLKKEDNAFENLKKEYETINLMLSNTLIDAISSQNKSLHLISISKLHSVNEEVKTVGIIKDVKVIKTKKGDSMAYVKISDGDALIEVVVFPNAYHLTKDLLYKNVYIVISGHYEYENNQLIAANIEKLEDKLNG